MCGDGWWLGGWLMGWYGWWFDGRWVDGWVGGWVVVAPEVLTLNTFIISITIK